MACKPGHRTAANGQPASFASSFLPLPLNFFKTSACFPCPSLYMPAVLWHREFRMVGHGCLQAPRSFDATEASQPTVRWNCGVKNLQCEVTTVNADNAQTLEKGPSFLMLLFFCPYTAAIAASL
eukprot:160273-Chlamydomonas_euryale.AAC.2